ncbi:aliphatic sulfonate ABC transporter substrate-binding protein [uncultured Alsobacter sp.]|uniref:aliphatic sulfonate ABC transporter substrate-binding protein n=1 Tax=uncultured Alsobacter sp. TaxID=1748258 RepID=UPI0025D9579F|nr:aliphatic sulfonate ABC transporter substrate-binding protein [uncultured Alsobacter sp.]
MTLTRRQFVATAAAATLAGAAGPAFAQQKPIRVGYIADFFGASLTAIANDQGLWAKHGLTPDIKVFTNGPIQIQALGAGSLDVGYIGPGALWLPASGKAKILAINAIGFSDRVIAQAGLTSMAALKGKKVAVPEGTSGDMILRLALAKAGMTLADLQIIKMDPSTLVSAFASKQVDAAGIWYPLVGVIKKTVPDLNELAKNADFYPQHSFPSSFVARNEVIDQDPDLVKRFIAVLKDANDYRAADFKRAVGITSKFINIPVEVLTTEAETGKFLTSAELAAASKDGTVNGWLKGMTDQFVSFGRLEKPLDAKDYYLANLYAGG